MNEVCLECNGTKLPTLPAKDQLTRLKWLYQKQLQTLFQLSKRKIEDDDDYLDQSEDCDTATSYNFIILKPNALIRQPVEFGGESSGYSFKFKKENNHTEVVTDLIAWMAKPGPKVPYSNI
jgi:hypothetical protein